jgi:hypothetical protein
MTNFDYFTVGEMETGYNRGLYTEEDVDTYIHNWNSSGKHICTLSRTDRLVSIGGIACIGIQLILKDEN